jgi:ABC-type nitrate/sulfonate/bicarbonate transport system permease component
MRKKKRVYVALLAICIGVVVTGTVLALLSSPALAEPLPTSPSYAITWDVVANGGTTMTSSSYTLLSTTGQAVAGEATGTNYSLLSGYWQGIREFLYKIFLPIIQRG